MNAKLSRGDRALFQRLEEALWQEETRFNVPYMDQIMGWRFHQGTPYE
jgi:hypothetical protein